MVISPLAKYTAFSPNCNSPRNHEIDTITIHCMVGHMTASACADMFANPAAEASSNYCVGDEPGDIACSVPEGDRSWCTSSPANDNRAITIEVASDRTDPYAITDGAMTNLINLLVDICKRNNIKELKWKADPSLIGQVDKQNMTAHRWFSGKACPGDYIFNREAEIAAKVNAQLGVKDTPKPAAQPGILYKVQLGAFGVKENAQKLQEELKTKGYDTIIVEVANNAAPTVPNKKSINEIAREVIDGKWGNGEARKNSLVAAGYDYDAVQKEVNSLL